MQDYENRVNEHKEKVSLIMNDIARSLVERAKVHDNSKMEEPELSLGIKMSRELTGIEYGTPEYFSIMEKYSDLKGAHYDKNSHHPEHYGNGINGMNLLDVVEMVSDWMAAMQQKNPSITREEALEGVEFNINRFEIDGALADVIRNSV